MLIRLIFPLYIRAPSKWTTEGRCKVASKGGGGGGGARERLNRGAGQERGMVRGGEGH